MLKRELSGTFHASRNREQFDEMVTQCFVTHFRDCAEQRPSGVSGCFRPRNASLGIGRCAEQQFPSQQRQI
jgi:hypothetical protein